MNRNRYLRIALGLAVSAFCLWLAFRNISLRELGSILASAHPGWILLAGAVQISSVLARARRWTILLAKERHFSDSLWAQGVGYLFTNLFPLRLGEVARVVLMARRCALPILQVAASGAVERVLDVTTILIALSLVLPWMQVPSLVARAGLTFGFLILLALGALIWAVRARAAQERLIRALEIRFPKLPLQGLIARWEEIVRGLEPFASSRLWPVLGWSVLTWSLSIAMYWMVLRAFNPQARLIEATFMVVALSLAVSVPSSPGFIGVFQYVGRFALVVPFGAKYDAASALAISVSSHLIYYVLTTSLGILGLWRYGETLAGLWQAVRSGLKPRTAAPEELSNV